MARKCRIKEEIARKTEASTFLRNNIVPEAAPKSANAIISIGTNLSPECVSRRCECVPGLEYLGQQRKKEITEIQTPLATEN